MMSKSLVLSLLSVLCFANQSYSQNIKDEDVEYSYIQLPTTDIKSQVKNYNFKLVPVYEEKNKKLMAEYELEKQKAQEEFDHKKSTMPEQQKALDLEYEKDMVQYEKDLKLAEEKYANEMDEYNKKSLGSKIIEKEVLGQNNKPQKHLPNKPYRRTVSEPYLKSVSMPKLQTSYDYAALCNTYLKLYGFEQNPENALNVTINLFGFDNTNPTTITTQQNEMRTSGSTTTSYPVNYYSTEFTYRHPMSIQIKMPDGKEVLNVTPAEYNNYSTFKSPLSKVHQSSSYEMHIKSAEEKILQNNLTKLNNMVNSLYGYQPIPRKAVLYFVKNKDQKYTDLLDAYNDASMGLKLIVQDEQMANEKLNRALEKWNAAFAEADITKKDARIDQNVAIAVGFNLLEVNFAMKKVKEGFTVIEAMNKMDLSKKEKKRKEDFEMLYLELKKRK